MKRNKNLQQIMAQGAKKENQQTHKQQKESKKKRENTNYAKLIVSVSLFFF
jgi:hypothetical protein